MSRTIWLMLLATFVVPWPASAEQVGNAMGVEGRYQIFEFDDAGLLQRAVSNLDTHVAWPSAVRIGSTVYVFASVLDEGKWMQVHRWHSNDGAAYVHDGVVFSAGESEPFGVGPTTVGYQDGQFLLYYGIRNPVAAAHVGLARSPDGRVFTSEGIVHVADSALAPGGIAVSYVCADGGRYRLFLQAYDATLTHADSYMATATSPEGLFGGPVRVIAHDGFAATLTGSAGDGFAQVSQPLPIGVPVVVQYENDAEVYLAVKNTKDRVLFDRPLAADSAEAEVASFTRNKAEISYVQRQPDDSWLAGVTGYGQFEGITSEYTSLARSANIDTQPFALTGSGYALSPYFDSGKDSAENPEPIRTSMSCSG